MRINISINNYTIFLAIYDRGENFSPAKSEISAIFVLYFLQFYSWKLLQVKLLFGHKIGHKENIINRNYEEKMLWNCKKNLSLFYFNLIVNYQKYQ